MKYASVIAGCMVSLYIGLMLLTPVAYLYAGHEATINSEKVVAAIVEQWDATYPSMTIKSTHIQQMHPWTNFLSVGAYVRLNLKEESTENFVEMQISKHENGWDTDQVWIGQTFSSEDDK